MPDFPLLAARLPFPRPTPSSCDADVIVVGAGPAGLGAALALRAAGVASVVVVDREDEAGGMPRTCVHSPFGWREFGRVMRGPAYARRLAAAAHAAGVTVLCHHAVTALHPGGRLDLATPEGPRTLSGKRIILATGIRETPRAPRLVSGSRPLGVLTTGALQGFVHRHHLTPFRAPVIVGTEWVSFSALLTCRSAGIAPRAMIEAQRHPTARAFASVLPWLLGVPLRFDTRIEAIVGRDRVESVRLRTPRGHELIHCDGVLFTGGFVPEAALVRASALAFDDEAQAPVVDQYGRCSDPAYFAAGNILRAVETAGWSHREGRAVGAAVALDLAGGLPPPDPHAPRILPRGAVKQVVPGRLAPEGAPPALPTLQIRLAHAAYGTLEVRQGETSSWKEKRAWFPERRILIPLDGLSARGPSITVDVSGVSGAAEEQERDKGNGT